MEKYFEAFDPYLALRANYGEEVTNCSYLPPYGPNFREKYNGKLKKFRKIPIVIYYMSDDTFLPIIYYRKKTELFSYPKIVESEASTT